MVNFNTIVFFEHGSKLGYLISHRAHSLRPIGARAYAPAGVCREKSKKLCDLWERKGNWAQLSKFIVVEIRTNPYF